MSSGCPPHPAPVTSGREHPDKHLILAGSPSDARFRSGGGHLFVYDRRMTSAITIIALVVGLLLYLLASNSKAQDIGRILFFSAVLALLIALAPASLRFFH